MEHIEKDMRESKVPSFDNIEELNAYIQSLVDGEHDYGTCVYAMSMAATAAFNYVAHTLGVTGFQASCADLDILRRTRGYNMGYRILNYEDLLYPQYLNDEHFPSYPQLVEDNKEELSKKAKQLLKDGDTAHPDVVAYWKYLAGLT